MENSRNRIKVEFIKKNRNEKIFKQQSELTFNVIDKSYTNYGSYLFKQNEVLLDKPIYVGFALLELSTLIMYETYYNIQPYFGQEKIQLHFMDCDRFVLSIRTQKNLMTWRILIIYLISVIWMKFMNYWEIKWKSCWKL